MSAVVSADRCAATRLVGAAPGQPMAAGTDSPRDWMG